MVLDVLSKTKAVLLSKNYIWNWQIRLKQPLRPALSAKDIASAIPSVALLVGRAADSASETASILKLASRGKYFLSQLASTVKYQKPQIFRANLKDMAFCNVSFMLAWIKIGYRNCPKNLMLKTTPMCSLCPIFWTKLLPMSVPKTVAAADRKEVSMNLGQILPVGRKGGRHHIPHLDAGCSEGSWFPVIPSR